MSPKLQALMISLGFVAVLSGGTVALREVFAPRQGVTVAQLVDAGIGDCNLRTVRCQVVSPSGRMRTQEGKARVCGGDPILSPAFRDMAAQGWSALRCTNVGAAAGGESELADVADECACSSGANCTAQRIRRAGGLAVAAALPNGATAGPDQAWQNFSGAGCVAKPCTETFGGMEWPAGCPRQ